MDEFNIKSRNKHQEGSLILPIAVIVLIIILIIFVIYYFLNVYMEPNLKQNNKIPKFDDETSYEETVDNDKTKEDVSSKFDEDISIEEAKSPTNITSWDMKRTEWVAYYIDDNSGYLESIKVEGFVLETKIADIGNLLYGPRLENLFIKNKGWEQTLVAGGPLGESDGYLGKVGENTFRYIEYSSVYEDGIQANYTSKIFYSDVFKIEDN